MRQQVIEMCVSINHVLLNATLDAATSRRRRGSQHKPKLSRKDARKQSREGKKRRKADYFSSTSTGSGQKRSATSPRPESPPPKRRTVVVVQSSGPRSEKGLSEILPGLTSKKTRAVAPSKTPSSRLVSRPATSILPRSQQEEDEDRYIALLERRLASGKGSKNGPGYFKDIVNDGLG